MAVHQRHLPRLVTGLWALPMLIGCNGLPAWAPSPVTGQLAPTVAAGPASGSGRAGQGLLPVPDLAGRTPAKASDGGPAASSQAPGPVNAPGPGPVSDDARPAHPVAPAFRAAGRVILETARGQYIKDPSFSNNGRPIGDRRSIAFGNLSQLYVKFFEVGRTPTGAPGLAFSRGEVPLTIEGLASELDGRWAPQLYVAGSRVWLFYCAGRMRGTIEWPSFRLHLASASLADITAAERDGRPWAFREDGTIFDDQVTFAGTDRNFAMIDPAFYVDPAGQARLTYVVVQPAVPGVRPWQEFVRSRRVSADDPRRATGPDQPLVDGFAGGLHDGIAEAPDVITLGGQPVLFVSSHAGDRDQRVLAGPIGADWGRMADSSLKPVLVPGAAPWESNAVGSTGAVLLDGSLFLLYQGMDAAHQFSLGWQTIADPR